MFLHSPAMSEGAAGLTPRIDLCLQSAAPIKENFKWLLGKIQIITPVALLLKSYL